jgi:microcompartment protein CcmK/EutM
LLPGGLLGYLKAAQYLSGRALSQKNRAIDMFLGKVIGTVWATRKDDQMVGMKLQIVREVDLDYEEKERFVVAVDSVGAGVGEIVLVAQGSSARQTTLTHNKPVDAVISAIVDKIDVEPAGAMANLEPTTAGAGR